MDPCAKHQPCIIKIKPHILLQSQRRGHTTPGATTKKNYTLKLWQQHLRGTTFGLSWPMILLFIIWPINMFSDTPLLKPAGHTNLICTTVMFSSCVKLSNTSTNLQIHTFVTQGTWSPVLCYFLFSAAVAMKPKSLHSRCFAVKLYI